MIIRPDEWLKIAIAEKGVKERAGDEDNPRIIEYLKTVELGDAFAELHDEIAWCAAFVNWTMIQAGISGTNRPNALSWLSWGRPLSTPEKGCIVVMKRGHEAWMGHVGFYMGSHGNFINVLGGNQSNMVCEQLYKIDLVRGFRMPY
jgi:uncharacterized protein (TIGR02594 family)